MIINLLVGIVILIAGYIAYYLLSHLNRKLFGVDVASNQRMKSAAKIGGLSFIILVILGIIALLLQNDIVILAVLLIATAAGTILEAVIMNIVNHPNR
ncbi:hypothetical protein YK48G_17890 [Lentilactobacillus fungorum]|uniref:DUF3784 domain-containing protein n=1 Tax=Lentilactobacillus fungorum TaxID=2201250 RepID=A0ABQ3W4C0_9LACO|nr:hypothetical protein [Lentilactobacillus fungorum]GHP14364.1 hypothetical protein YK48G_17890 [Lentilactobacillus fungorum]